VQHINLSYSWTPHPGEAPRRHPTEPLRNPLMDMLQAVREAGSIAGAAKSLQLSYRHIWGELKRWEQTLGQALILWEKGQAARLSEFADKLLWAERQAQARLAPQISALHAELEKTFAMAFDPASHLLTVYASHDDALVQLQQHTAQQGLHLDIRFCGSVDAIRALNEGRCTVAGFHVPARPAAGSLMARTYKPLLKRGQHKLMGFATRAQGWMVQPGNPLDIRSWQDLTRPGVRLVNRTLGTGTRLLLDEWLQTNATPKEAIAGYEHEESSHGAVAACIASGQADMGLGIASAALAQGLDFVPLAHEHYWLVCLKSALETPAMVQLRSLLQADPWRRTLSQQAGYSVHESAGQIQSLKRCLPWWPV
jgi:putative molybdopterin biosynthesis protein